VVTFWVGRSLLDGAADLLAFVALALLDLVADLCALEEAQVLQFLFAQKFFLELLWIMDCETWNGPFVFTTLARLVNLSIASLTAIRVTSFFALMPSARQEFLAFVLAVGNWVSAGFPLSSDQ